MLGRQVASSLPRYKMEREPSKNLVVILIRYLIVFSLIVGLMKGPVTHALLIASSSYCDLADHCPHEINLNVFRASFDALLRRSS